MEHYRLNLRNSVGYVPDHEGADFADLAAAHTAAIGSARSILAEEVLGGTLDLNGQIEICADDGSLVRTVRFSEAVRVRGPG